MKPTTFLNQVQLALFNLGAVAIGLGGIALMGYGALNEIHWVVFGGVLLMTAFLAKAATIEVPSAELPDHYLARQTRSTPQKAAS